MYAPNNIKLPPHFSQISVHFQTGIVSAAVKYIFWPSEVYRKFIQSTITVTSHKPLSKLHTPDVTYVVVILRDILIIHQKSARLPTITKNHCSLPEKKTDKSCWTVSIMFTLSRSLSSADSEVFAAPLLRNELSLVLMIDETNIYLCSKSWHTVMFYWKPLHTGNLLFDTMLYINS